MNHIWVNDTGRCRERGLVCRHVSSAELHDHFRVIPTYIARAVVITYWLVSFSSVSNLSLFLSLFFCNYCCGFISDSKSQNGMGRALRFSSNRCLQITDCYFTRLSYHIKVAKVLRDTAFRLHTAGVGNMLSAELLCRKCVGAKYLALRRRCGSMVHPS